MSQPELLQSKRARVSVALPVLSDGRYQFAKLRAVVCRGVRIVGHPEVSLPERQFCPDAGDPPGTTPTPPNASRHADCRRTLTVYPPPSCRSPWDGDSSANDPNTRLFLDRQEEPAGLQRLSRHPMRMTCEEPSQKAELIHEE